MIDGVQGLINRRRRQMLLHSFLYYQMNTNIISDYDFDKWAMELVELQEKHPDIAEQCVYAEAFKDFDGSGGSNLPYSNHEIQNSAFRLVDRLRSKKPVG